MTEGSKKKSRRSSQMPGDPWKDYCRYPESMITGNRVQLLVDGIQAYPVMLDAIKNAKSFILMESYIFHDDVAGQLFAHALSERAGAGLAVYLIVDGVGTFGVSRDLFHKMETAGVRVLIYRSPAPWRRSSGLLRRNHRKLLVVDGEIGFAGGLNVGDEWRPKELGGAGWHDVHLRIEGPAVRQLAKLPVSTWQVHGGVSLGTPRFLPEVEPTGHYYVNVVGSRERKKRRAIRQTYLQAIRRARRYIYIANAYFLPDSGVKRALRNAVERGVDVRVMVPKKGDILPFQLASEAMWNQVLKSGIRLFLWEDAVLHAKTAVIDDIWTTVGSFNLDHRSWTMNLEVNVNTIGVTLAKQLKEVFVRDQQRCTELTWVSWGKRPWHLRIVQRFFYLFRKFM